MAWGIRPPMNGGRWLVRRDVDGRWLCRDGQWRKSVAGVENFKLFRSIGWVNRAMRRLGVDHWEARAVYAGECLDRDGNVSKMEG